MSYNLTLQCGCLVYIACDPLTSVAHARIIERRDPGCRVRKHEIGLRLPLWEIVTHLEEVVPDPAWATRQDRPGGCDACGARPATGSEMT